MADSAALRKELRRILDKPIFPHEGIDPIEAVTNYLLDNDVVPVVKCEKCKWSTRLDRSNRIQKCYPESCLWCDLHAIGVLPNEFCSNGEVQEDG